MPFFDPTAKDDAEQSQYIIGFPKGQNSVQDAALIDDRSLATATNVQLVVDGVERRYGSEKPFSVAGSKVYASGTFYKKTDGTRHQLFIANGKFHYRSGTSTTITTVSSPAFTNADTCFVQARDKVFIYNGTDKLRNWNGTTITEYTALTTPVGLAVAATGGTGSTAYSYRVSAFNSTGETLACAAVAIANGVATLSATTYNAVTWTATAGATGYNVYGRQATGLGESYMTTVYTNAYNDTGADTPLTTKLVPDANNTGGVIAKFAIYTTGRQYAAGITEGSTYHPTRLYYSGTVQYIDSYAGGEYGGGWVDVYANDGGEIVGLYPYQTGVLVFKTNGIFKFNFTSTGLPQLTEVTRGHGGVSWKSIQAVDNDIIYVGQKENRIVVMTVGQQENYVGDQLRTNNISIFIDDELTDANRSYLTSIASFMYDYKFGFTYTPTGQTENTQGWILDTRFGGWVKWTGDPMECTQYVVYDDGTATHLYGCSNTDGYMTELIKSNRNDNGAAFRSTISTKQYNGKMYDVEKIWRNPSLWFKYISGGSINVEVLADGTRQEGTATLTSSSSGVGPGGDLAGAFLPGASLSTLTTAVEGADKPQELEFLTISRSLSFTLTDETTNSNWLFMGIHLRYAVLEGKPLGDEYRVEVS